MASSSFLPETDGVWDHTTVDANALSRWDISDASTASGTASTDTTPPRPVFADRGSTVDVGSPNVPTSSGLAQQRNSAFSVPSTSARKALAFDGLSELQPVPEQQQSSSVGVALTQQQQPPSGGSKAAESSSSAASSSSSSPAKKQSQARPQSKQSSPNQNAASNDKAQDKDKGKDGTQRPSVSYARLAAMAIDAAPSRCCTVSDMYGWIEAHFPYYRNNNPWWKNCIRHNLSMKRCFVRVSVDGRFKWTIDPNYEHELRAEGGNKTLTSRKRRQSAPAAMVDTSSDQKKASTSAGATSTGDKPKKRKKRQRHAISESTAPLYDDFVSDAPLPADLTADVFLPNHMHGQPFEDWHPDLSASQPQLAAPFVTGRLSPFFPRQPVTFADVPMHHQMLFTSPDVFGQPQFRSAMPGTEFGLLPMSLDGWEPAHLP